MSELNTNAVQSAYSVEAFTPFCSHWLKVRMIMDHAQVTQDEAEEALRHVRYTLYVKEVFTN